jgi:hypothetical protein
MERMEPKTFIGIDFYCGLWATGIDWGEQIREGRTTEKGTV